MSSILKALKKLEDERSQAAARPEHVARYEERPVGGGSRSKGLLVLACGVLLGVLGAGGWFMLKDRPPPSGTRTEMLAPAQSPVPHEKQVASQAVVAAAEGPVEEAPGPASQQIVMRPPASELAAVAATEGALPHPGRTPSVPSGKQPGQAAVETSSSQQAAVRPKPAAPVAVAPEKVEEVRVPAADAVAGVGSGSARVEKPPLAKVTEIYFEPDGGSMAVVDDLPVMEGTKVNGALVDKILVDRVRFLVEGRPVEILVERAP